VSGKLRVLPLGGVGEIGKNLTVVEYEDRIVVVDCGLRFPTAEMMGIDLVLPDFTYLRERVDDIEAIVITHGHEDHLGALPWVLRDLGQHSVPVVYGGQLTVAMARSKLDEHKLRDVNLDVLPVGDVANAGPFEIELVHLTHSIPDACGVALTCDLGTVLFTGDYKFDQTPVGGAPADMARLAELGREGLLLLCGDSTNADRPGISTSESTVGPQLERLFSHCDGRIVVTCFASNIHRVQQVVDAAAAHDRKVALIGRSMRKNVNIGRSLGHIDIPDGQLIPPRELETFRDDKLVIISTGSQGEPLAALRRMAYRDHPAVELKTGDTVVFAASPIPGNERAVNETIDRLYHIGCDVVTARDAPIHASGHGYAEEVKMMLNLTHPRYVMPVHGDFKRMLIHSQLAEAVGVPPENIFRTENGTPLEIDEQGARLGERHRRRCRCGAARPPHAVGRRHLHHRRDGLRAGRLVGRPARGARPRRAVPGRQPRDHRRAPRSGRGLARPRRRATDHRDRRLGVVPPRRHRGVHLRAPQATPDGPAGCRRGLKL
jgi:ribonuclease J